jgi:hypothetical protein
LADLLLSLLFWDRMTTLAAEGETEAKMDEEADLLMESFDGVSLL